MGFYTVDPEDAVLGCVLLDNSVIDKLTITAEDFHSNKHRTLFQTMIDMRSEGTPIDILTLSKKMPNSTKEIADLMSAVPTASAVDFYADQLMEDATKRRVIELAKRLLNEANDTEPDQLVSIIKKSVETLQVGSGEITSLSSIFDEVLDELAAPSQMLKTPYKRLNTIIGGYRSGAVYIVAARPGVGKTMFALQNAYDLSEQGSVMFFSMEMGKNELVKRLISAEARVFADKISRGELDEYEWKQIAKNRGKFQRDLIIEDRPGISVNKLRSAYRKAAKDRQINAIVVDYLGLMHDSRGGRSRYEKVTNISNDLKQLARELNIPIIALHQLNREVESRTDPRPNLSDLRDSGAIEQDADVVMLLHRPTNSEGQFTNEMLMYIAKNRHGRQGGLKFTVDQQFVKVVEQENY